MPGVRSDPGGMGGRHAVRGPRPWVAGHLCHGCRDPSPAGPTQGVRPTEALLSAVAGCSGMDVLIVLRKMRQDVTGLTINVTGVRAEEYPRPVVTATVEYVVRGHQVSEASVARAVSLSETKYCGVMASLKAEITTRYRVEEE